MREVVGKEGRMQKAEHDFISGHSQQSNGHKNIAIRFAKHFGHLSC
jgi:hypothetical protein